MVSNQLPFEENAILTANGEAFPIPVVYKGWSLSFGSLENVQVPLHLRADLACELDKLLTDDTFTQSKEGNTEVGLVTVTDLDKKRTFEVILTFVETGRDDYYRIDSIREV